MDIQTEIIKTIDLMIEKRLQSAGISQDVQSIVTQVNTDGTYRVAIHGGVYDLKCGTNLTLQQGTPVWVHIPNGDISKAFILATIK